jgi:hypothetical protein
MLERLPEFDGCGKVEWGGIEKGVYGLPLLPKRRRGPG